MNDQHSPATDADSQYQGLEKLLREQLRQQPDLLIARLMLLELFFKTGRRPAFLVEARKLYRRVENPESSLEWQRCAAMGRSLDPDEELYQKGSSALLRAAEVATVSTVAHHARRVGEQPRHIECFRRLADSYEETLRDPKFLAAFDRELVQSAARPSSLLHLRNLSRHLGGAQIYLKREDQSPPNTHLMMMVTGQALLAQRLGCASLVTSTVNGLRGLAVASVAARFNLECTIYISPQDRQIQLPRVFRMSMMGATVETVSQAGADVREVALDHWADHPKTSMMIAGLDALPDPYPAMHRMFIAEIGRECKLQVRAAAKRTPSLLVARGHRTADALGLFPAFTDDRDVRMVCVEPPRAAQPGDDTEDADPMPDVGDTRVVDLEALEGLSYPRVTREHQWLKSVGHVEYIPVEDARIAEAATDLARFEGIVPGRETARALAWAMGQAKTLDPAEAVVTMFAEAGESDPADLGQELATTLEHAAAGDRRR